MGERDLRNATESDTLTAICFDKIGEHLAVGDKGGRVIIFKHQDLKNSRYFDYRYFSEFQSHEPEFDHLKSVELGEKINSLTFLPPNGANSLKLLSTNDRVIKLWKIGKKTHRETNSASIRNQQVLLPTSSIFSSGVEGKTKKQYKNCHNQNINSISASPDCEHFLSSDDLTINMWNLENNCVAY